MSETRVDARGLRCPWPALRLARAVREGARRVRIVADDPAAPREIAALAAERGWRCMPLADAVPPEFLIETAALA